MRSRLLIALALASTVARADPPQAREIGHGDLRVYRSRKALGPWSALVPRYVDFARERLVLVLRSTRTSDPTCCLVAERREGRLAVRLPGIEIVDEPPCDSAILSIQEHCREKRAQGPQPPDDPPVLVRVPRGARVLWVEQAPPPQRPPQEMIRRQGCPPGSCSP